MSSGSSDQVHFNAVRRALENGNAAVMVGAGFSRNAENGNELATWPEVAKELWRELNPNAGELTDFSASTVTQLGEQYSRVFSRPSLEELLKRLIPDERVAPGLLHRNLLSLPWSEIFTTNYDTLLERAAESIVDRAHYTVMCREDIPQSKILDRRRIVKLHGSFPSQRPFIFTEEDYRRYPENSAPFINLVRQSMLENVFCLIGFSGDDPNFLYWIGWVRDMLDEHALPIYLFVIRPPSLGTQKLLESRRVTAVVLPTKSGVEEWDYTGRFATLFETLKKPLTADVLKWGERPQRLETTPNAADNSRQRHEQIVSAFSALREMRDTYPGWLIAPYTIRNRLSAYIFKVHDLLQASDVRDYFLDEAPHAAIAILADYSWHLEILLQSMEDSLAEIAMELLKHIDPNTLPPSETDTNDLRSLQAQAPQEFRQRWKALAVGVLRWAREGLRQNEFHAISGLLRSHFRADLQITDELVYEEVLLKLYMGQPDIANLQLKNWDVRSPDNYMQVKKGMLLGELGDVTTGLKTALIGLKRLRKNQRSRANSTLALSQEAWACLAIGHLQKSSQVDFKQHSNADAPQEFLPELVTQRLTDLAAAGHDVGREVLQLVADLNAETPAPAPPVTHTPQFELGRYSTTHYLAISNPHQKKIRAAFAWLTLTDHVALVPRVGNATFDIDSFAQAAWWIQVADSMQRVFGVMTRLVNSKMLEPRQSFQLIHSAGWLSRFQVAKIPEPLALELLERSMLFVERMIRQKAHSDLMKQTIGFQLQIISRLIIRATAPGFAVSQLERIVGLYKSKQMLKLPELWKQATNLTKYCFEALSATERLDAIPLLASIPDLLELNINDQRYEADWFSLHLLPRRPGDLVVKKPTNELVDIVNELISRVTEQPKNNSISTGRIWMRLFWLKEWGGVSKAQTSQVANLLIKCEDWPSIPEHYPTTVFIWLTKAQKKTASKLYKQWLLRQKLTEFSAGSPSTRNTSRRSWSMREADDYLISLYQSFEHCEWSEDELVAALMIIKNWWDQEGLLIQQDMTGLKELKSMFIGRMHWIDTLIASFIDKYSLSALQRKADLGAWVEGMKAGMIKADSSLLKTDLASALNEADRAAMAQMDVAVLLKFFDPEMYVINRAVNVVYYWTKHPKAAKSDTPSALIYSLAGVVSARRMPTLPYALHALTQIAETHPNWITHSSYTLINVGLKMLLTELAYIDRPDNTGIPDDSVPALRLRCVRLAIALRASEYFDPKDDCQLWLTEVRADPLPELRFIPV